MKRTYSGNASDDERRATGNSYAAARLDIITVMASGGR
jgi:hypothetical protein